MLTVRRVLWATSLGLLIALVFGQAALALCIVQPLNRLVKSSDEVWWGTVIEATAAPRRSPGTWELTVRLDDVLKGEGVPGDTYTVFTSTCGLVISRQGAQEGAASFIGQQRLFLVTRDQHGQFVAYSEIVRVNGRT